MVLTFDFLNSSSLKNVYQCVIFTLKKHILYKQVCILEEWQYIIVLLFSDFYFKNVYLPYFSCSFWFWHEFHETDLRILLLSTTSIERFTGFPH